MAGYLDNYGAGEDRREKLIKRTLLGLLAAVVIGGTLFFFFKNYKQERVVNDFLAKLEAGDYKAAYTYWGCTAEKPCADYKFERFLEDWGPNTPRGKAKGARITRTRACGSGVILTVDFGAGEAEKLWVEKSTMIVGFSPYPGCPAGM